LRFIFNLKFILNSNYFKMASVRVRFSPGFPLGGGIPAEQFDPAWWYETTEGEERLLMRVAQQNEAPPAEFLCSLEEDVLQRVVAPAVIGTPQRREFPAEQKLLCGKSSSICKSRTKALPDGHHF
jgi:hypothetical protein